MVIREINALSAAEIGLVAARMRQTLVEVLGEEQGTTLYSTDWLLQRVRWHLDPKQTVARIFVAEDAEARLIGHAIARIEHDADGHTFGYFSTVFVDPPSRSRGVATALIRHVESWLRSKRTPRITYNTAANHVKLIRLFERHGFQITLRSGEMVQLTKELR